MEQETKREIFRNSWFTIPEAGTVRPLNLYHKEQEEPGCSEETTQNTGQTASGTAAASVLPSNLHVLARAVISCGEEHGQSGERLILRITADDYYKLYVNGSFVGQGPAPAYPEHYYYNEFDLTDQLRSGGNILAVHLYYQGLVNRVWNSGDGRFGIACEISEIRSITKKSRIIIPRWRYKVSSAYSGAVTGYDTQFLEDFDSRIWDKDWNMPEFADQMWKPMVRAERADHQCSLQPTEMLQVYRIRPKTLKKTREGWLADMGEEITGALLVWAESDGDGKTIVIRCGEELEEAGPIQKVRYDMRCNCRYEEGWILSGKEDELDWFDYKAFRYAQLILPEGCEITDIALLARHYPFTLNASLKSAYRGDPELEKIWELCLHTQKYGTQEVLQDCMEREKGFYVGDGCYTSLTHLLLTGDDSLVRKLIDDAFFSSFITPGTMTCLDCSFMQEIAEFPLILISLILWHYRITGAQGYLRQNYTGVKNLLDAYTQSYLHDGLISGLDKWCVVEWPDNFRDGYDVDLTAGKVCEEVHVVINAYYLHAVRCANEISHILGEPLYQEEQPLLQKFYGAFYDSERHLFRDSTTSGHVSYVGNLFPFAFGLIPDGEFEQNMMEMIRKRGIESGIDPPELSETTRRAVRPLSRDYLPAFSSFWRFIACTLIGRPKRLMKPAESA